MKNKKKSLLITTLIMLALLVGIGTKSIASDLLIQANKQTHDGQTNITTFEGNVKVNMDDIVVKSPRAAVRIGKDNKPEEAIFVEGAHAVKDDGISQNEIKASIIRLSLLENKIQAEGDTFSSVKEKKKPVVTIKADYQEFDKDSNIMNAKGNVIINHQDVETHSERAKIFMKDSGDLKEVNLLGKAQLQQGTSILNANKIIFNPVNNEMVAIGKAFSQTFLEDTSKVAIWSNYQQYDQNSGTMMAGGDVKVSYKNYIATGPKAAFLPRPGESRPNNIVFYGRSKIQEGSRVIEADKIEITADPKNFLAEGNVKTTFTQLEFDDGSKKKKSKKKSKRNSL